MNLLQSQKIEGMEVEEKDEIVGERRSLGERSASGGRNSEACRGGASTVSSVGSSRHRDLTPANAMAFSSSTHGSLRIRRVLVMSDLRLLRA